MLDFLAAAGTPEVNLSVCTRVRLGSVLLQEGLMPHSSFFLPRVGRHGVPDDFCRNPEALNPALHVCLKLVLVRSG